MGSAKMEEKVERRTREIEGSAVAGFDAKRRRFARSKRRRSVK